MNILQDLWLDTAGKIFLLTFGAYLVTYLIYGGYIYSFFGERGSMPIGLANFSIAELVSTMPTVIITLFSIVPRAFISLLLGFLLHSLPFILGLGLRYFFNWRLNTLFENPLYLGYSILTAELLWGVGILLYFFQDSKHIQIVLFLLESIGAIFWTLLLPDPGQPITSFAFSSNTNHLLAACFATIFPVILGISFPFILGMKIGETAVKKSLLVKIGRLVVTQPFLLPGLERSQLPAETVGKFVFRNAWLSQKTVPVDIQPDIYEWSQKSDRDLFLIATFDKFVLIFSREMEGKYRRVFMVNRETILSIELTKQHEFATS